VHSLYAHPHTPILPAIFQVNQGKPVTPTLAFTAQWGCRKILQPVRRPLISTVAKGFWCKVYYKPDASPVGQSTASNH